MVSRRRNPGPGGHITGVLIVDKAQGMTSHDVVSQVRRAFRTRRVGHAGTLDPMATGVLVLLIGEATKLSSVLTTQSKEYEATVTFGVGTDSLDADGRVTARRAVAPDLLAGPRLELALEQERARTLQIPPAVSAIKVDGQRSHALARAGELVVHEPRSVRVHDLQVLARDGASLTLRVRVSKGYYVRSLARDLGVSLDTVAHLSKLRRTRSGTFSLEGASKLPLTSPPPLLSMEAAVRQALPCVQLTEEAALALAQGKLVDPSGLHQSLAERPQGVLAALLGERLVALVELSEDTGFFRVRRGICAPS